MLSKAICCSCCVPTHRVQSRIYADGCVSHQRTYFDFLYIFPDAEKCLFSSIKTFTCNFYQLKPIGLMSVKTNFVLHQTALQQSYYSASNVSIKMFISLTLNQVHVPSTSKPNRTHLQKNDSERSRRHFQRL